MNPNISNRERGAKAHEVEEAWKTKLFCILDPKKQKTFNFTFCKLKDIYGIFLNHYAESRPFIFH